MFPFSEEEERKIKHHFFRLSKADAAPAAAGLTGSTVSSERKRKERRAKKVPKAQIKIDHRKPLFTLNWVWAWMEAAASSKQGETKPAPFRWEL